MRRAVREAGGRALKAASTLLDRAHPPRPGVTVLIYHRVGGRTPVPVDLPRSLFEEQVAAVADRAVTLDEALRRLDTADEVEDLDPCVVVTFDDGTADVVEEALPILEAHGVPALLYVATKHVEEGVPFPDDGVPLSWSALADAMASGLLAVGSHTHSHALLDRVGPAEAVQELDRSIDLIGERLGVRPLHFAYPKALPGSPAADRAVRERFRSETT